MASTQLVQLARQSGLPSLVEIYAGADENTTCSACLDDDGRVYEAKQAPELPHADCQCLIGCRCVALGKIVDKF